MIDATAVRLTATPDITFAPTGPCPAWCAYPAGCASSRLDDDRRHLSATCIVPLSTEPPVRDLRVGPDGLEEVDTGEAQELCARLDQHAADAEPVLQLFTGEGAPCYAATMTLDEAADLARGILALVSEGRRS